MPRRLACESMTTRRRVGLSSARHMRAGAGPAGSAPGRRATGRAPGRLPTSPGRSVAPGFGAAVRGPPPARAVPAGRASPPASAGRVPAFAVSAAGFCGGSGGLGGSAPFVSTVPEGFTPLRTGTPGPTTVGMSSRREPFPLARPLCPALPARAARAAAASSSFAFNSSAVATMRGPICPGMRAAVAADDPAFPFGAGVFGAGGRSGSARPLRSERSWRWPQELSLLPPPRRQRPLGRWGSLERRREPPSSPSAWAPRFEEPSPPAAKAQPRPCSSVARARHRSPRRSIGCS